MAIVYLNIDFVNGRRRDAVMYEDTASTWQETAQFVEREIRAGMLKIVHAEPYAVELIPTSAIASISIVEPGVKPSVGGTT